MFERIGNDIIMHIPSQTKATINKLEHYYKLTGERAKCGRCGAILKPGDWLDHYFPHEVAKNRCKKCYNIEEKERMSDPRLQKLREKLIKSMIEEAEKDFAKDD